MLKPIRLILAVLISVMSLTALSLTCPRPSDIKNVNGEWVAPTGWIFDQAPEGHKGDAIAFIGTEWQAIVKGQAEGSVDWCHYAWKNHPEYERLSVSWWGNPMFVKREHLAAWTPLSGGAAYRCKSSINDCSFIPAKF